MPLYATQGDMNIQQIWLISSLANMIGWWPKHLQQQKSASPFPDWKAGEIK